MAKKKQSQKETGKSKKGPILFDKNIEKHKEELEDTKNTKNIASSLDSGTYMIKLVLIGDAAVGKTSIRRRYLGQGFKREHLTTLGADFAATTKTVDNYQIKYQIWDLAGQPMFKNVLPRFFKGCFGALVIFDITRKETFENLTNWIENLYKYSNRGVVPVIVLANKTDLDEEREVTIKEAKEFIKLLNKKTKEHEIENFFLETSAKTGLNIDKSFEIIGQYIIEKFSCD